MRHNQPGFSILELVLVLGITVILSLMAVPRFGFSLARYRLDRAARRMALDIAYAQTVARRCSVRQPVTFDVVDDSYTLPGVADINHRAGDYTVNLADSLYDVNLVSVQFDDDVGHRSGESMAFDMWGMPFCGSPAAGSPWGPLANGVITIQSGQETRSIRVSPTTGRVIVQ